MEGPAGVVEHAPRTRLSVMSSTYTEWAAMPALGNHLACLWIHVPDTSPASARDVVVTPDGCVDIVWNGSRLFVAGPDTESHAVGPSSGRWFVGARFEPGMASTVLGIPASALLDDRVDLIDVLPDVAAPLLDELLASNDLDHAARRIEATVEGLLPNAAAADRTVIGAVRALQRSSLARPVATLAVELGVSERHLLRRCRASIGYGPKMLDRVMRFRRFNALLTANPGADLAGLAVAAGYADQAHLSRECRAMSGMTPSSWSETFKAPPSDLATLER